MENIETLSPYGAKFLLVLLRVTIFISLFPFFGSRNFPGQFKIGMALAFAAVITPIIEFDITEETIPVLISKEVILGIVLGLTVRFVFLAVNTAGQAISNAVGLSMATVFDPEFGQSAEIARLLGILAMLFFIVADAHHDLIFIFVKSYELIPAGGANINDLMVESSRIVNKLFLIAVKIAAPVVTGMLVSQLLLGFIYKATPQINIFFVSLPLQIFLGYLLLLLSIPVFAYVLMGIFSDMREDLHRALAIAAG